VLPFILRGVRLIGIDSVECDMAVRIAAWQKLATEFKTDKLDELSKEIALEEAEAYLLQMLQGKSYGRVIVNMA
jgi:NADPH:quinone reductase-like Zn-dependent oxidoreductase